MSKKIHDFNDIIRKLRKKLFGKGPERIHTVFVQNMVVPAIIGFFIKKDKLCLWAIILNIILFLVPISYPVIGTLVFGP